MTPTIQDWQRSLPTINADKRDPNNPRIYARYSHKQSNTHFYVAEGRAMEGVGYLYWGFAVVPGRKFAIHFEVSSHDLETGVWIGGVPCKLDTQFISSDWMAYKNIHFPPTKQPYSGRATGRSTNNLGFVQ